VPAFSGLTSQNFTSKQIGHFGLVAGMIDELGISGIIDEALPKTRDHILPHSAIIKAMLLNGLGFNERRLYIFPGFSAISPPNSYSDPESLLSISTMMFFFGHWIASSSMDPPISSTRSSWKL